MRGTGFCVSKGTVWVRRHGWLDSSQCRVRCLNSGGDRLGNRTQTRNRKTRFRPQEGQIDAGHAGENARPDSLPGDSR